MTIVVHRDTGGFAASVRIRVRLDGMPVGRVRRGKAPRLRGSGDPQRLSASLDRVGSNELTVTAGSG